MLISASFYTRADRILGYFPPVARAERKAAIEHAVESEEGWDQESRLTTAEGNERWVRSIGESVVEDGEVVVLCGASQDITESKGTVCVALTPTTVGAIRSYGPV